MTMTDTYAYAGGPGFMLALEARAAGLDEPDLNTAITAARAEYRAAGPDARRMWSDAAAHGWARMAADPVTGREWASDVRRLAILATAVEARPDQAARMILACTLGPDTPPLADMRRMLEDGRPVDFQRLLDDLLHGPEAPAPDDETLHERIRTAEHILDPIAANAPTDVDWAIMPIRAAFTLARGDTAGAMGMIADCRPHLGSSGLADAVEAQAAARMQTGDGTGMGMAMGGPRL